MESLSHFLDHAKITGIYKGILISQVLFISQLLFVDDIFIFCDGSHRDVDKMCIGLETFKKVTSMVINLAKSSLTCSNIEAVEIDYFSSKFSCPILDINEGLKYLCFYFKPNDYRKVDWLWLISNIEKCLNI